MVPEAQMGDGPAGKKAVGEGWFIINAREAVWVYNDKFGAGVTFEGTERFSQLGINVQVMWPGQPNGYYHGEEGQEDFLVLKGECILLVEGQERRLKAWDFVHCPPWTRHIFVGAGEGPFVMLAVGARNAGEGIIYPVSEPVLRHGAGVTEETTAGEVAYAEAPKTTVGRYSEGLLPDW